MFKEKESSQQYREFKEVKEKTGDNPRLNQL